MYPYIPEDLKKPATHPAYINPDHILGMYRLEGRAYTVIELTNEAAHAVTETPEEILALIKGATSDD